MVHKATGRAARVATYRSALSGTPVAEDNYLSDDWNDNKLTSRDSPSDGFFAHPQANEAGDTLIGRYRPVWETFSGTPSAAGGVMVLGSGDAVQTNSRFVTGSWEADITWNAGDDNMYWNIIANSLTQRAADLNLEDGYYFHGDPTGGGGGSDLQKDNGGTNSILVSGDAPPQSTQTIKLTRDSYGGFEYIQAGASKGTATDTTFTSSEWLYISGGSTASVDCDNLVVV